jgi:hypothetical protein
VAPDRGLTRMTPQAQVKRWWIVWIALLPWVIVLQLIFPRHPVPPVTKATDLMVQLAAVVPLFVSIVIRWLALPRASSLTAAFPLFFAGLVLAEACGVLGIVLGGPYRDALFVLSFLGLLQFAPLFARRLAEPKPKGFIPNN